MIKMKLKINRELSPEEKQAFIVTEKLIKAGFEAYFAGGAVRDEIMGHEAHDIDIATSARPEEIEKLFPEAYDRGKAFGVMAVRAGEHEFEVATFRNDIGTTDHRRPKKVEFTSSEQDAKRRDFTINGLFYDPQKEEIIDYVGGVEDIKNKTVCFIGVPQERIDEDYLRILRAVRFVNRFDFKLEKKTEQAIKENAEKLSEVSRERIRDEIAKMLIHSSRVKAIKMLDDLGMLKLILPELLTEKGVKQPPEFHSEGDVWTHTMLALENLDNPSEELAWAVLLHDIEKPSTYGEREHPKSKITFFEHDAKSAEKAKEILERFKYSNEFIESVSWAISQHMRIINAFREGEQQMSERKQEKLFLDPRFPILLEETKVDLLASLRPNGKPDLSLYENALKRKEEFENRPAEEREQVKKFDLITGRDIIDILKIESGPKVGQIKAKIEQAFLNGEISTRKEALEMLEKEK